MSDNVNQRAFNAVVTHLKTQNKQCVNSDGECLYLHEVDGVRLKCAVGALMTEEALNSRIYENTMANFLPYRVYEDEYIGVDKAMLLRLQHVHDGLLEDNFDVPIIKSSLKTIARDYNLDLPLELAA